MANGQDDPIDCIVVLVEYDDNSGNYIGTYTTPASGSFAETVSCDVKTPPPIPDGDYSPSCESDYFAFGDYEYDQPECTPDDQRIPPVPWTTFSFTPDPTSWTSQQTITVTMTADG